MKSKRFLIVWGISLISGIMLLAQSVFASSPCWLYPDICKLDPVWSQKKAAVLMAYNILRAGGLDVRLSVSFHRMGSASSSVVELMGVDHSVNHWIDDIYSYSISCILRMAWSW